MAMRSGRTQTDTSYNEMFTQRSRPLFRQRYSITDRSDNRAPCLVKVNAAWLGHLAASGVNRSARLISKIEKGSGPQRHPVRFRIHRMKRQGGDRIFRQNRFELAAAEAVRPRSSRAGWRCRDAASSLPAWRRHRRPAAARRSRRRGGRVRIRRSIHWRRARANRRCIGARSDPPAFAAPDGRADRSASRPDSAAPCRAAGRPACSHSSCPIRSASSMPSSTRLTKRSLKRTSSRTS